MKKKKKKRRRSSLFEVQSFRCSHGGIGRRRVHLLQFPARRRKQKRRLRSAGGGDRFAEPESERHRDQAARHLWQRLRAAEERVHLPLPPAFTSPHRHHRRHPTTPSRTQVNIEYPFHLIFLFFNSSLRLELFIRWSICFSLIPPAFTSPYFLSFILITIKS